MAASATDYFMKTGMSTATTLSAPGYTIGNTSINVGTTAQLPTTTGIFIMIDEVETVAGVEQRVAGTYNEFRGTVSSGTQINNLVYVGGDANRNYSAGATTRVYMTISSYHTNRLVDGLLVAHDQDGTLKAGAVDNVAVFASGVISTTTPFSTALNPTTHLDETTFDYVASGCVWSGDAYGSTRVASMTSGVVYIDGQRVPISAVTSRTFTASKDTYIDVSTDGIIDYTEVANNAASPALSANHIRIGIIVTGASNIANVGSVNQGQEDKVLPIASSTPYAVTDSLGNLICCRDPQRKILGFRQILSTVTNTPGSGTYADIAGLSCPVIVPSDRKIKITVFAPFTQSSSAGGQTHALAARESTTELVSSIVQITTAGYNSVQMIEKVLSPSSGSHTYLASHKTSSTGNVQCGATSTSPAFIKVELA